jgi:voltage-gated potassium channel
MDTPGHPERQAHRQHVSKQRWELLTHINALTDKPMIALSFVWLGLLILDFTQGLGPMLQTIANVIWALFVLDFVIEVVIAPHKLDYLRRNWLTAVSLLLPALRVLRVFGALRVLRAARAVRSVSLLRLLTSLNRGMRALGRTLGRRGIGYVVALTIVVTFAGAAGMAQFENPAALREEGYDVAQAGSGLAGYGEAMWWAAMIMTTMGSEYWPKTIEGRVLGWLLSVYAFAIFGYITATIASYFVRQDREQQTPAAVVSHDEVVALRQEIAALHAQLAHLHKEHASTALPQAAHMREDEATASEDR